MALIRFNNIISNTEMVVDLVCRFINASKGIGTYTFLIFIRTTRFVSGRRVYNIDGTRVERQKLRSVKAAPRRNKYDVNILIMRVGHDTAISFWSFNRVAGNSERGKFGD